MYKISAQADLWNAIYALNSTWDNYYKFSNGAERKMYKHDSYNGMYDETLTETRNDWTYDRRLKIIHYYRNNSNWKLDYTIYGYPLRDGSTQSYDQLMLYEYVIADTKWTVKLFKQFNLQSWAAPSWSSGLSAWDVFYKTYSSLSASDKVLCKV